MKWTEVKIRTTYEAADAVGEVLYRNGANGLVIEEISPTLATISGIDWDYSEIPETDFPSEEVLVMAYFPTTLHLPGTVENIREAVENLREFDINVGEAELTLTEVEEEDWANNWKQYFKPVLVGERLLVKPEWEIVDNVDNRIIIHIDPGMAFGTGTHATTIHCMTFLEKYIKRDAFVYDVGTGSGILSITAAKLGAKKVQAFDKDELAVKVARENVALNHLTEVIDINVNDLLNGAVGDADIIVANITAGILTKLIPSASRLLTRDGTFILAGIILERELEVQRALIESGLIVVDRLVDGEWVSLVAKSGRHNDQSVC